MKKIYILPLLLVLFLIYPIAHVNYSAPKSRETHKIIVIKGTIGSSPESPYINKANSYAGMEHWLVPLALYDSNLNKMEDLLETKILDANGKDIEVIVAAAYADLDSAINAFESLGGRVIKIYPATASFRGIIPAEKIEILANMPEIGWIQSVHKDYVPFLRVSIPQQRIGTLDSKAVPPSSYPAPSWTPWGQNIYGDPNTAIAITDTGLDDSHPELGPYGGPTSGAWETVQTFTGSVSGTGSSGSHYNNPSSSAWREHQIYLQSGVKYNIILDWSTSQDLDLYVYKPGKAPSQDGTGDDYFTRAYTTNKPESVTFTADVSGYWVIAVDHYSSTTSSTSYQVTVKKYVESSGEGIDWNAKIIYWKDFTSDGRTEPADGNGHGSHCAGIAAGKGYSGDPYGAYAHRGVAPNAKLVGLAIFKMNGNFDADLYEVVQWIIDNAQTYHIVVSSNSWGGVDDAQLNQLMNELVQHGVVTVVAAGNSAYGSNVGSPGSADLVITVGAVNDLNEMAEYSTSGDSSTGNTIKPDVTANGGSGWNTNHAANDDDEDGNGYKGKIGSVDSNDAQNAAGSNNYVDWPGTSMATPHVAGLAALIIDAMGGWDAWDYSAQKALLVKMIILMTAVEFTRAENPSKVPRPSLDRGEKDKIEGYGRINADAAIMAVLNQLEVGQSYTYYLGSTSPSAQWYAPRAWAGYIYLQSGQEYTFTLDVPSGADFDLYIYRGYPDQYGQPVIVESGTSATLGGDEIVTFTPSESGKYYVVVKWIDRSLDGISDTQNAGQFTLTIQAGSSSGGGGGGGTGGGEGTVYTPPCTISGTVSGDGRTGAHYNSPDSSAWSEFKVSLSSGVEYRFTLDWDSGSDLDMYLYKPNTAPSEDGSGSDYATRAYTTHKPEVIEHTADITGTWTIAVDHYSGSGSANFQITIEIISEGGSSGGGGGGGGGGGFPVTFTGSVQGDGHTGAHYNDPSSPAWSEHTIDLTAGNTYKITLNWDSSSDLDLYLYKPGASGSNYYKRAYTTNQPEVIEFTADVSGTWTIAVDHYSGSGSANYQVTIELISGGGGGGGGGFTTISGTVSGDGSRGPHFNNPSSSAWSTHSINLQSGVKYRMTLSWDSSSDLDLYVYKPGASGSSYYARAYTLNKPEVLEFTADTTGTWIIAVDHYSTSGSANYEITIEVVSTSNVASIAGQPEKSEVVAASLDSDNDGISDNVEKSIPLLDPDNPLIPAIYPPIIVLLVSLGLAIRRRRK